VKLNQTGNQIKKEHLVDFVVNSLDEELRKAIEYDSNNPGEVQDEHLSTMVCSLGTGYYCVIVTVYSENPPHIGIVDRHESSVSKSTMELFQGLGYTMIDSGVKEYPYKDGNSYQHAFAEFRVKTEEGQSQRHLVEWKRTLLN